MNNQKKCWNLSPMKAGGDETVDFKSNENVKK